MAGENLPYSVKALKGSIPALECHLPEAVLQINKQRRTIT